MLISVQAFCVWLSPISNIRVSQFLQLLYFPMLNYRFACKYEGWEENVYSRLSNRN